MRGIGGGEEVFNGQSFLRADESDDALVGSGTGKVREVFAGFLTYAHARLFTVSDVLGMGLATGHGQAAFDGLGGAAFAALDGLRKEDA